ncbi:MAG TPA: hypothetical protein VN602_05560 [Gemmatimonadaceae bacterium]|nr:hypothetical protein [Gemmatimonadaceae bacterium]
MDKDVFAALIGGICFVSVTTVLPVCVMYLRRGNRTKEDKAQLPVADIVARLERIETGMESMSAEIERIGEGQRFTTRLLNERDPRMLENVDAATRRI